MPLQRPHDELGPRSEPEVRILGLQQLFVCVGCILAVVAAEVASKIDDAVALFGPESAARAAPVWQRMRVRDFAEWTDPHRAEAEGRATLTANPQPLFP